MTVQKGIPITKKGFWWEEVEEGLGTWEDDDKLVSIQTGTLVLRVLNREGIWAEDKVSLSSGSVQFSSFQ